jgi:hypothetical protein
LPSPAPGDPGLPPEIRRDFVVPDESRVAAFLEERPDVLPLLGHLRQRIAAHFGDDPVVLERFYDPEMPGPALFVTIRTRRSSPEGLAALPRFDREWWLGELGRTAAPLVVTIAHV